MLMCAPDTRVEGRAHSLCGPPNALQPFANLKVKSVREILAQNGQLVAVD